MEFEQMLPVWGFGLEYFGNFEYVSTKAKQDVKILVDGR